MKLSIRQAAITLALARGDMLSLDDARGVEISVQRGALWVTQERSRADHFVGPGARFTVRFAALRVDSGATAPCCQLVHGSRS